MCDHLMSEHHPHNLYLVFVNFKYRDRCGLFVVTITMSADCFHFCLVQYSFYNLEDWPSPSLMAFIHHTHTHTQHQFNYLPSLCVATATFIFTSSAACLVHSIFRPFYDYFASTFVHSIFLPLDPLHFLIININIPTTISSAHRHNIFPHTHSQSGLPF